jgi:hypothetical protein
MVRGYDEVKLGNVDLYRDEVERQRAKLTTGRLQGTALRIVG